MDNLNLCIGACRIVQLKEIVDKLLDPNCVVVFTTAPAPRTALGEYFGKNNFNAQGKIVGFLKKIGVDFVFDTAFGADMTTFSEANELVERIGKKEKLPMFNSCCPAFKKYIENFHKELIPNLSTAKTPIAQIATYIKTHFAVSHGLEPENIFVVALTPCVAKKIEIKNDFLLKNDFDKFKSHYNGTIEKYTKKAFEQETNNILQKIKNHQMQCEIECNNLNQCANVAKNTNNEKIQLTDSVITTQELKYIIDVSGLNFDDIEETQVDDIAGESLKFGKSGGVLECVIENTYFLLNNKMPTEKINFTSNDNIIFECQYKINDTIALNIAKLQGIKNLEPFLKSGEFRKYDFVEVMSCNGGCVGGTGQTTMDSNIIESRKNILLSDKTKTFAFNNKKVVDLFRLNKDLFFSE